MDGSYDCRSNWLIFFFASINSVKGYMQATPTLKQTQRENGNVTTTRSHEIHVSRIPQTPTPLVPVSSAEKKSRKNKKKR